MPDFRIKLNPEGKDFLHGVLPNVDRAMKKGIRIGMYQAGELLVKTLRDGIQREQKTGKFYKVKGRFKQASAPGQYAGIVTGAYLKSVDFMVGGNDELEYGFKDRKATSLELGTRNMQPRPALALATEARQSDTFEILERSGRKFLVKS